MRKSAIVIGFGAFFVTLALLLKFYAYPRLAVIPLDQNTGQTLSDPNAKYFDVPTLTFKQGTIVTHAVVVADKKTSESYGHNSVLLSQWQYTSPQKSDGSLESPPMSATTVKYALDRNTGKALDWSGTEQDGQPVDLQGSYVIKLPFGLKKGNAYPYWDTTLQKPVSLKYQGTEKIRGMETYKYNVSVPDTVYKKEETPGSVFGLGKSSPAQNADRSYSNEITIWADPVTGVFMKMQQHQLQHLTIPNHAPVTILDTTSVMDDKTVKKNVDDYSSKGMQLNALGVAPWALLPLGLILILAGIVLLLISGRNRSSRH